MVKFFNKNIIFYVWMLLPLTYVIGILVTEAFVFILTLYFLFKNRKFQIYKNKMFLFFLTISIYIGINGFINIPHNDLLISSIFHFRFSLLIITIFFFIDHLESQEIVINSIFLKIIFGVLGFIFFDALVQFILGKNIFGYEIINYHRISGIFGSEYILGSFLTKFLPFMVWLIFFFKFDTENKKFFLIFFFSIYFIIIYLSGERTSFALMLLTIIISALFINKIKEIYLISFGILILFVILTNTLKIGKADPYDRLINKTFNQITSQVFIKNKDNTNTSKKENSDNQVKDNLVLFSKDHNGHYILAYKLFTESPFFGVGPKGFRYHCRIIDYDSEVGMCSTHPHNIPVQILSELGILGFVLYVYGLFFIIRNLINYSNKKDIFEKDKYCFIAATISLIINFFPFLPSGNFFNNWMSINNFFYIGIYFYSYNKISNKI